MWFPIIGLIIGILLGSIFTVSVPVFYAKYMSVAVLAALDSLLGGFRGLLEDSFDGTILLSGFFTNALLAALLAYLGDHLGVDLYLAAVIAFGIRLFGNLGFIRRDLINRWRNKRGGGENSV
ncbi:small basic family protein [Candidatus Formimonas warabiya]|uniref:Small basic protein n=1 Tax=Formimonas warabiya TaxID=1761012 RepID=A0A3G1KRY3_FORW1|nr:small basic family protein [Candidatus Formimonas warabiya]ATW25253.1 small basic protein [Candidatus Formimonas warabiya]